MIAAYIENHPAAAPTVKQHLAAIRMLFDFLVTGQVVPMNPASSVRGPKYVVKVGKTPVLKADQARALIDSIKIDTIVGLRDRAIIGTMCFTFARVSAMVHMKVDDYYQNGKRWWIRLHEKGGKRHEVPAHHNAEAYIDAYLEAAGIREEQKTPLFRSVDRHGKDHGERHGARTDVLPDGLAYKRTGANVPGLPPRRAATRSGQPESRPILRPAARWKMPS